MKLAQLFEAQDYGGGHFHAAGSGQINWSAPQNAGAFFYIDTRTGRDFERTLRMSDHRNVVIFLLEALKMMDWNELNRYYVKSFISICQANGYDYPEFGPILKSVMAPDKDED